MQIKVKLTSKDFEEMLRDYLAKHNIIAQKSIKDIVEDLAAQMKSKKKLSELSLELEAVTIISPSIPSIPQVIPLPYYPTYPDPTPKSPFWWYTTSSDTVEVASTGISDTAGLKIF